MTFVLLWTLAPALSGCVAKTRKVKESERPKAAQTVALDTLIQRFNTASASIHSYQAKVRFDLRSGSIKSGELKDYHEIKGYFLYRSPDHLRMIGQIPGFGLNALDMVSDGREFRVSFAPYKKFIIGSTLDHPNSKKPLENLRPIHLLSALRPAPILLASENHSVFIEEVSEGRDNFYIIYEVDRTQPTSSQLTRKIWIDRFDLNVSRQQLFSQGGVLESDTRYAEYALWGEITHPKLIDLFRPQEDYGLKILIEDIRFNLPLDDPKFELVQPEGYEAIEVGKKKATR